MRRAQRRYRILFLLPALNEVRNGTECGIGVKNYTDVKAGDLIEVYEVKEIARSL